MATQKLCLRGEGEPEAQLCEGRELLRKPRAMLLKCKEDEEVITTSWKLWPAAIWMTQRQVTS